MKGLAPKPATVDNSRSGASTINASIIDQDQSSQSSSDATDSSLSHLEPTREQPPSIGQMIRTTLREASDFIFNGLEVDEVSLMARDGQADQIIFYYGAQMDVLYDALLVAARYGQFDCVRQLLDHEAPLRGSTPDDVDADQLGYWQQFVGYLFGAIRSDSQLGPRALSLAADLAHRGIDAITEAYDTEDEHAMEAREFKSLVANLYNSRVCLQEEQTLLHLMAQFSSRQAIETALHRGGDPLLRDKHGKQGFDLAQISGNEAALEGLKAYAVANNMQDTFNDAEFSYVSQDKGKIPDGQTGQVLWHQTQDDFLKVDLD